MYITFQDGILRRFGLVCSKAFRELSNFVRWRFLDLVDKHYHLADMPCPR
jgi:hypothetical protein